MANALIRIVVLVLAGAAIAACMSIPYPDSGHSKSVVVPEKYKDLIVPDHRFLTLRITEYPYSDQWEMFKIAHRYYLAGQDQDAARAIAMQRRDIIPFLRSRLWSEPDDLATEILGMLAYMTHLCVALWDDPELLSALETRVAWMQDPESTWKAKEFMTDIRTPKTRVECGGMPFE
jgi:hypothetical protein